MRYRFYYYCEHCNTILNHDHWADYNSSAVTSHRCKDGYVGAKFPFYTGLPANYELV